MLVSILHRITGGALTVVGLAVLTLWLVAIGGGETSYDTFVKIANHPVSLVILALLTWTFWQHLFSGLRHLVLDTGAGYELKTNRFWAVMTLAGSLFATAARHHQGGQQRQRRHQHADPEQVVLAQQERHHQRGDPRGQERASPRGERPQSGSHDARVSGTGTRLTSSATTCSGSLRWPCASTLGSSRCASTGTASSWRSSGMT